MSLVDVIGKIQDLIERLPLDQPMDAEDYMVIDYNVTAREIPTDEEIVSIVKNCESNELDDGQCRYPMHKPLHLLTGAI
ncbi:2732_t:CDS:2, partial [Paraglomus occultum]